ncbi:MAG: hypothetical protein U0R65_02095 [Candidatus Nanopelagicales bacterium]
MLGDDLLGVAPFLARLGFPVVGRVGQSVTEDYLRTYLSTPQAQSAAWVLIVGTNNPGDPADVAGSATCSTSSTACATPRARRTCSG